MRQCLTWVAIFLAGVSGSGQVVGGTPAPVPDDQVPQLPNEWGATPFEMGPRVIVFPGEILILRTDVPHDSGYAPWVPDLPGAELLEPGDAFVSHWEAYGGRVLQVDDNGLLYQAPAEPGVAFLRWDSRTSPPITLTIVVPGDGEEWDEEVDLPREYLNGVEGCFLPTTGGTAFRLFACLPGQPAPDDPRVGLGFKYVPYYKPMNPPPPSRDCPQEGAISVFPRDKHFIESPLSQVHYGTYRIGETLKAELAGLGYEVEVGMEFHVTLFVEAERVVKNTDFYRCEGGKLVYCGNKTTTWRVLRVVASFPEWFCKVSPAACVQQRGGLQSHGTGCAGGG